jgi:pilus assembly protein CpaE
MSDIILVGITPPIEKRIRSALGSSNGALTTWDGPTEGELGAAALAEEHPVAVILGCSLGSPADKPDPFDNPTTEVALELARNLEIVDPTITTLLVAKAEAENLQQAMSVGIREVVTPDAKKAAIKHALERALSAGRRLRDTQESGAPEPTQRFILIVSAKGGSGKTVISSNLAVGLAQQSHRRCVLVDLDLQFGDAATALLLSPEYSMLDAAGAADKGLSTATLKVFLTSHAPSGLHVLCAPDDPSVGDSLSSSNIGQVLDLLAGEFGTVVVDTDPGLSEITLMALERATDIIIVADLDVPSVRGTRKLVEALDAIDMTTARRHLILNRANSKVGLTPAEVQEAVGIPIDIALPSSRDVPISMNEGRPIAVTSPRSQFGKQITELVGRFLPTTVRRGSIK